MVIYGEYLFLENFVTGLLLSALTIRLAGGNINGWRLTAAGLVCGLGGFTIFLNMAGLTAIVVRVIIGLAVMWILSGKKAILQRTLIFISLTFLSGGAAMAFLLWQQQPALSGNGALYMHPVAYGKIFFWGGMAFTLTAVFIRIIRVKRLAALSKGTVRIHIDGKTFSFEGLADSGNSLKDPITGRAVSLIGIRGADKLEANLSPERFTIIPYHAVGTETGLLRGFRSDKIEFCGRSYQGAIIAIYEGDFDDYDVLLNREVLNEEII